MTKRNIQASLKRVFVTSSCCFAFSVLAENTTPNSFEMTMKNVESEVAQVGFSPVRLDFANWLEEQRDVKVLKLSQIHDWRTKLEKLSPATICQDIRKTNLQLHLNLLQNRQTLVSRLTTDSQYTGVMSELPDGEQWYLHWLNAWLLINPNNQITKSDIAMLKKVAQDELTLAHYDYVKSLTNKPEQTNDYYTQSQHQEIRLALRQREQRVYQNLSNIFAELPTIPKVKIRASSLPESFPAPGIYDSANNTFYYHFTEKKLAANSLDWLYLHEAVPGHHMQAHIAQIEPLCPVSNYMSAPMVTIEGWGAYVETLGKPLGLFNQPSSLTYALQWRVLRALRVMIDIGIHFEGWTDEEALNLWRNYLPDQMDVANREVARIKRWPVQVITYVYGKYLIEETLKTVHSELPHIEAKEARNYVLKLTNQPPHALAHLPALFAQQDK